MFNNKKEQDSSESQFQKTRPVDRLAFDTFSKIKNSYLLVSRKRVSTWKGIIILAFFAGTVATTMWFVNNQEYSTISEADDTIISNTASVVYQDADSNSYGPASSNTVLTAVTTSSDNGGGGSSGGTVKDTTPPAKPSNFTAASADKQIMLTWNNPPDTDFIRVKILRKEGSAPSSHNDSSAVIIYEGTGQEYTDIELNNNIIYYYAIFAYDKEPNYSNILTISSQPKAGETSTKEQQKQQESICYGMEINNLFGLDSEMADCVSLREAKIAHGYNRRVELNSAGKQLYQLIVPAEDYADLELNSKYSLAYFIHNYTTTTEILGAGERAGVINSYRSAFNKLPATESDWQDIIKIANGRWPSERSELAENRAKQKFQAIYLREPNIDNPNDNAAVTVIAYGLRPANRNTESEKAGIKIFKAIYGNNPTFAIDWDIVRAIAYSGATR